MRVEATGAGGSRPPSRRWFGHRLRVPVVVMLSSLGLVGGAVAATGILRSGDAVPDTLNLARFIGGIAPDSSRLLPMRVADPAGGPDWGVRLYRSADQRLICAQAGRVQEGQLGIIGRDGAFADDGRFHALKPGSDQQGVCGAFRSDEQIVIAQVGPPVPASGFTGRPGGTVGGCLQNGIDNSLTVSAETRQRLEGLPLCRRENLRLVQYGFAGPDATRVVFGNDKLEQSVEVARGLSGAYLFVVPLEAAGGRPMKVSVTYENGRTCPASPPTSGVDPGCEPER